jgi:hypothetical protein
VDEKIRHVIISLVKKEGWVDEKIRHVIISLVRKEGRVVPKATTTRGNLVKENIGVGEGGW